MTTDEASRQGTVVFDAARVSGAEVFAALERSGFRLDAIIRAIEAAGYRVESTLQEKGHGTTGM